MISMIEKGKQLGVEKRLLIQGRYLWYSYAIQKKNNIYYVYESEIFEDNMAEEMYEYEKIKRFNSIQEVKNNFISKYDLEFGNIGILKGQKIFNVDFYD